MDFRKNSRGYGNVMEFHFLVQIFRAKTGNILSQKAGFSAFLCHGKLKLVMESYLILLPNFCVNHDGRTTLIILCLDSIS